MTKHNDKRIFGNKCYDHLQEDGSSYGTKGRMLPQVQNIKGQQQYYIKQSKLS